MSGPLAGVKVIEMVGLGATPFCAMMLADMGAEVIRVDRPGGNELMRIVAPQFDTMARSRRSLALDLKRDGAIDAVLRMVEQADILLEGFRPGVMERLGLGPDKCFARNPKLVYGRLTGWGQDGPLAQAAGHDLNYIALSGVLHTIGKPDEAPSPPMNFLGDMAGGGMSLAFGVLCALHETGRSGRGQVVDAAMLDGSALLATMNWGLFGAGIVRNERGVNTIDGASHFYNCYVCADGKYLAVASAEPQFYALLRKLAGLEDASFDAQNDPDRWPQQKEKLARVFRTKTRSEWCALMEGTDVCFAPVLDWREAPQHPHNVARQVFIDVGGVVQPAPAPRFSRTPAAKPTAPVPPGSNTEEVLRDWGFEPKDIESLRATGAIPASA